MAWLFITVVPVAERLQMHRMTQNQTHAAKKQKRRLLAVVAVS
jgi:hypothetical protein